MEIYVVKEGDTIASIAEQFGVSVERLMLENGLSSPDRIVVGQSLIIAYPKQEHVVREGETLQDIADLYQVSIMQILRNNSFLSNREFIYPGETLIISYNTVGSIRVNGYTFTFINRDNLIKALPNLTYLSIFNYITTDEGDVVQSGGDETEIVNTSLEYGVLPLLMITTLSNMGAHNIEVAYNILLNEGYQLRNIEQYVSIMKSKGYRGVNVVLNYLNPNSQQLYLNFIRKISERLQQEGLLFFITINYEVRVRNGDVVLEPIDYGALSSYVQGIILLKFLWGSNYGPPAPVSNISHVRRLVEHVIQSVPPQKVMVGNQILGYDWQLPYIAGRTVATSMTITAVLDLAFETNSVIQYDDNSRNPFFYYNQAIVVPVDHIVWFIDVRSINSINEMVTELSLSGSGVWNIMYYYPQLWTSINAQFDIVKLI